PSVTPSAPHIQTRSSAGMLHCEKSRRPSTRPPCTLARKPPSAPGAGSPSPPPPGTRHTRRPRSPRARCSSPRSSPATRSCRTYPCSHPCPSCPLDRGAAGSSQTFPRSRPSANVLEHENVAVREHVRVFVQPPTISIAPRRNSVWRPHHDDRQRFSRILRRVNLRVQFHSIPHRYHRLALLEQFRQVRQRSLLFLRPCRHCQQHHRRHHPHRFPHANHSHPQRFPRNLRRPQNFAVSLPHPHPQPQPGGPIRARPWWRILCI